MRVVHEPDDPGGERTLATSVDVADSLFRRGRGLMFRRSIPDEYALIFPFDRPAKRGLHMFCVPFDIDAIWILEGRVEAVDRLPAWIGYGRARADVIVELPAGAADGVDPGDRIRVE